MPGTGAAGLSRRHSLGTIVRHARELVTLKRMVSVAGSETYGYQQQVTTTLIYSLLSSTLSVVNKYTLDQFPFPAFVLAVQLTSSASVIHLGSKVGFVNLSPVSWEILLGFVPLTISFFVLLASSLLLMANSPFNVFLICKSLTPFFMSLSETLYFRTHCPSLQSFIAMAGMAIGSVLYTRYDAHLSATYLLYAVLFICCSVFEGLVAKQTIQKFALNQTTRTLLMNALACPIAITWTLCTEITAATQIKLTSAISLGISCALGLGMGIATMKMRTIFSATYVTIVGVCNKFLSLGFASLVLSSSPSFQSTLSTAFVLLCGSFYNGSSATSTVEGQKQMYKIIVLLVPIFFMIITGALNERPFVTKLPSTNNNGSSATSGRLFSGSRTRRVQGPEEGAKDIYFEHIFANIGTTGDSNSVKDSKFVCGAFLAINSTSVNQAAFTGNTNTTPVSRTDNTRSDQFLTTHGLYGRLGNRLHLLNKLVAAAQTYCCGVSIPANIVDGWHPLLDDTTFVNLNTTCRTHLDVNQSTCASKSKSGHDWFYSRIENSQQLACFKPLMQRYLQINSTHAVGKKCPESPHAVVHVRSGDIARGSFNTTTGTWAPGSVHAGYGPYPTSYYVAALHNMTKRAASSTIFYVLCEDVQNPTCDFFQKAALNFPFPLQVRIGKPLLEDIHLLLCANEVVVSKGFFARILALSSKKQIVHDFIQDPRRCRSQDGLHYLYYISDFPQLSLYAESIKVWHNTGYQRFMVNKYYTIQTCDNVNQTAS